MGETTEMILEGILCQVCGVYMGEGDGYPVTCRACSDDRPRQRKKKKKPAAPKPPDVREPLTDITGCDV